MLSTLIGCADSAPTIGLELEYLDNDAVQSWVGIHSDNLTEAWGEPSDTTQKEGMTKLTYVLIGAGYNDAISKAGTRDLQTGPQTNGIDNDMGDLLRGTMVNTCMAEFTIDDSLKVIKAELHRLKGANECDTSKIYDAGAIHNDA